MIRLFLLIIVCMLSTACMTVSSSYTPKPIESPRNISPVKEDITFSIGMTSEIGDFSVIDREDLVKIIKDRLMKTGLYRRVVYAPIRKRGDKHLHFHFVISGAKEDEAANIGTFSGTFLMLIPVWLNYFSDMSVFVIENDKETFSASATENIKQVLWLPLIIVSPVLNDYTTGKRVINKQVSYLISEIAVNGSSQTHSPKKE